VVVVARLPSPCVALVVHEDRLYMSGHTDKREILKTLPPGEPYPDDGKSGIWSIPLTTTTEVAPTLLAYAHEPFVIAVDDVHVWFQQFGGIRRIPRNGGPVQRVAYYNAFWVSIDGEHAYILVPHSMFRLSQYDVLAGESEDVSLLVHGDFARIVTPPGCAHFFSLRMNDEDRTELHVHDKVTGASSRRATFDGHGCQLAIVGDRAVVLTRGEPIRVVSLLRKDGPCREIRGSEGALRFVIANDTMIYFASNDVSPKGTVRLMKTHVDGFTSERAMAEDLPYEGGQAEFSWHYAVHGRAVFYATPDNSVVRADLI